MPRGDGRSRSPRPWGFWTEHKLNMLAAYLPAFTRAASKSPRALYLDLFAGQDRNVSKTTGEEIEGSARVALNTQPLFTKVVLFELPENAGPLGAELRSPTQVATSRSYTATATSRWGRYSAGFAGQGWDLAPTFAFR